MAILIDKKYWKNASAFISMNEKTHEVKVYGKFVDDGRGHSGPETSELAVVPQNLIAEVEERGSWNKLMTPELEAFCDEIWAKAKKEIPWFGYAL